VARARRSPRQVRSPPVGSERVVQRFPRVAACERCLDPAELAGLPCLIGRAGGDRFGDRRGGDVLGLDLLQLACTSGVTFWRL